MRRIPETERSGLPSIYASLVLTFDDRSATEIEHIFSHSGSAKRMRNLQIAFDSPQRYGKGLDWTGYTTPDVARLLIRYLYSLPDAIIPTTYYERTCAIDVEPDRQTAIEALRKLFGDLPPVNRQLLVYMLDLLAVFASKAHLNKMTTSNLAFIFQRCILSNEMRGSPRSEPKPLKIVEFLIDNQGSFLVR